MNFCVVTTQGKAGALGGDGGGGPGFPGLPLPSCRVSWSPLSSTPKIEEVLRHRTQIVSSMGISPWVSSTHLQYGNLALGVRIALIIALVLVGSSLCLHKTGGGCAHLPRINVLLSGHSLLCTAGEWFFNPIPCIVSQPFLFQVP